MRRARKDDSRQLLAVSQKGILVESSRLIEESFFPAAKNGGMTGVAILWQSGRGCVKIVARDDGCLVQ